jgi:hypothetical protein
MLILTLLDGCSSFQQSTSNSISSNDVNVISQVTTRNTLLLKTDVAQYFCHNLTEYFNTYKYYKIMSEVFTEKEKQNNDATTRITKTGSLYTLAYEGSSGQYVISFSNKEFYESEQILTFGSFTVLGNAIRRKVYDTFAAWIKREEISLKANYNSHLFKGELDAAVEIENWYNSLSVIDN